MPGVYVVSPDPDRAAELVQAATEVAEVVHLICLGAPAAGPPAGATSLIVLEPGEPARPEDYAQPVADLIGARGGDLVLIGASVSGWELAARVATILKLGLISEVTRLRTRPEGGWEGERVMYAGAAVQTESWSGPAVVTIAAGYRPGPARESGRTATTEPIETIAVPVDTRLRVISREPVAREGVDLASATRIVCAGMGVATIETLAQVKELATDLDAELACTRPVAEDREWLPTERYLGISGVKVRPDLYLGLGVSGQVQHTVAIRDAKVIVGVDTNPQAPLFGLCDYAVVADLGEIVPLLRAALGSPS